MTGLKAKIEVGKGWAAMTEIAGTVLGGALSGGIRTSLDVTPSYSVNIAVDELDLREYAKWLPGQQTFKGLVTGFASISGQGYDPRTVGGSGQAKILEGDLGTLPVVLRAFNVLKLAKDTKTAFDSADVGFTISNGETTLEPVRLTGNAFSLEGDGSVDVRGELEVKLRVLAGRDAHHIPLVSDLSREVSGQFFAIHVFGPIAAPKVRAEPLAGPIEILRKTQRNKPKSEAPASPWRTGLEGRLGAGMLGRLRALAN